jgi:uncharacterized protein (DUF849 family)
MIQAALNGNRTRTENPAIPVTAAELAESAREAVAAGAGSIHFHVRDANGRESLAPSDVAACLHAMRRAIPRTPIGISTAEWIVPDSIERQRIVSEWTVLPDFVSVNFNEIGGECLARSFIERGVGVEAGIGMVRTMQLFMGSKIGPKCLRVLFEPEGQQIECALKVVGYLDAFLDRAALKIPRLTHGYLQTVWPFVDAAAALGHDCRVGFEDTLTMPDGTPAPSNAALVAEAVRRTAALHARIEASAVNSHATGLGAASRVQPNSP